MPAAAPTPFDQLIVPCGVLAVGAAVSVTFAVQVVGAFTATELGVQSTSRSTLRALTLTEAFPLLGPCTLSLGV